MLGADWSALETSVEAAMAEAAVKVRQEGGETETPVVGVRVTENSGDDQDKDAGKREEGDKVGCGGNRWPRQETLALLKIRLDMDAAFRDSSLKGPLWEEVARKLAQLGHKRSAKKCKEKFENVYKYHKRTREGRGGKTEGKTYKFFDELQALENQFKPPQLPPQPQPQTPPSLSVPAKPALAAPTATSMNSKLTREQNCHPFLAQTATGNAFAGASTSSSTASDEGLEDRYRRKRKWKDYFRRLTRKLLMKQEDMQKRFLEAMEKRDHERMTREEAWRMHEMGRINREHEILVQERSTAAAKDAAVIVFLQKLSGHLHPALHPSQSQSLPSQPQQGAVELPSMNRRRETPVARTPSAAAENGGSATPATSSRWPKIEVQALISLRRNLDFKYQENAPKGPLWEEISEGMRKLGYHRNAKRCKEKWENINKYFKKVKESSKERPENSRTCPYFHQLEAIYKEKSQVSENRIATEPLAVQPEQQWRPPQQDPQQPLEPPSFEEEFRIENPSSPHHSKERDKSTPDTDTDPADEEDDGLASYEIATSKLAPVDSVK